MLQKKQMSQQNTQDQQLLLSALDSGNHDKARQLIDKGVDVNCATAEGMTPLHLISMVAGTNESLFQTILKKTADVNRQDNQGLTALHYAAYSCAKYQSSPSILTALTDQGADINKTSHLGLTPLHMAAAATTFDKKDNPDGAYQTLINLGAAQTRTPGGFSSLDLIGTSTQPHVSEMLSMTGNTVVGEPNETARSPHQLTNG